jgi:glycerol-1-phosphate dehydrogenase [NAD(P)+]
MIDMALMSDRLNAALALARETRIAVIGEGVLRQVPEIFRTQFPGQRAVVVADPRTWRAAGAAVQDALTGAGLAGGDPVVLADASLGATMESVDQVTAALKARGGPAVAVAVGSGTINDLTKLASHHLGRPYLVAGTAASMDGYTAFGASITDRGAKQNFACPAPQAVVADLEVMRRAPPELLAAGYGDLTAKIVCGADWILADALGIEPIDAPAWAIAQEGLGAALENPAGLCRGESAALGAFVEGLLLGGFAMQHLRSSRPASGAEHQFSHLWDMERHTHNGAAPSHGFKVGVATHFIAILYEQVLEVPFDRLDVAAACAQWPDREAAEARARELFAASDFPDLGLRETQAKYVARERLEDELNRLRATWPEIRTRLRRQLLPSAEIRRRLAAVGAPVDPGAIGISRARMEASVLRAQHIRRRYTVLDLCLRTGLLNQLAGEALDRLYLHPCRHGTHE